MPGAYAEPAELFAFADVLGRQGAGVFESASRIGEDDRDDAAVTDETARPSDEGAPISTASVDEVAAVERALRAGLTDFELSPEDEALLEAEGPYAADSTPRARCPSSP